MTENVLTDEQIEAQLPRPVGYKMLIALPEVDKTFASGILKTDAMVHQETVLTTVGLVLDMGEQAYADKDRYPNGPWCKIGDYVVFRSNSGTRVKVGGKEYRFLNDDSIDGVVADPRGIARAA